MIKKSINKSVVAQPDPKDRPTLSARNAAETRQRILKAARRCFSLRGYENVGIREISGDAGVDAALVNRYFGNKEGLFIEVIQEAFCVEEHLPSQMSDVGSLLVEHVLSEGDDADNDGFNPLRLLLLAAASPDTANLVSARFHAEFIQPLAKKLKGRNTVARAGLIGSYVIGLATMRHLLNSPTLNTASQFKAVDLVIAAIQLCVDDDGQS